MRHRLTAAAVLTIALAGASPAAALTPERTTPEAARAVAHYRFDSYAEATDSRLVIGKAKPCGRRSRCLVIRLSGWIDQRYRMTVLDRGGPHAFTTLELLAARVT